MTTSKGVHFQPPQRGSFSTVVDSAISVLLGMVSSGHWRALGGTTAPPGRPGRAVMPPDFQAGHAGSTPVTCFTRERCRG
jgi:hypothetical protein